MKRLTIADVEQITDRAHLLVRVGEFEMPDQIDHLLAMLHGFGLTLAGTVHAGLLSQGKLELTFAKTRPAASWARLVTTLNWELIADELLTGDYALTWLDRSLLRVLRRAPSIRHQELAQLAEIAAHHMRYGSDEAIPTPRRRADPRQLDLPI